MFTCVQAARFVAAGLIVIEHAILLFALPQYYGDPTALSGYNWWLGVDFFFVLSGFVIYHAHADDIGRPDRLPRYLVNRVRRIYPTYAIVFAVVLVPLYFTASSYQDLVRQPGYLLGALLLLPTPHAFIQTSWTLQHEMTFYLVFASLIANRTLGLVVMTVWFLASSFIQGAAHPSVDVLTDPRHIEFLGGIAVGMLIRRHAIPAPRVLLGVGLAGFTACLLSARLPGLVEDANPTVAVTLSSALILGALVELERSHAWRAPAWLRRLGDASYALYLVHLSVMTVVVRVMVTARLDRFVPVPVLFVATMAAGTLAGYAFYRFVEVPIQAMLRRRLPSFAGVRAPTVPG